MTEQTDWTGGKERRMTEQNEATTEAAKLKRPDVLVGPAGMATIERAITLRLATLACTQGDCRELAGEALVGVCKDYLERTSAELRAARREQA